MIYESIIFMSIGLVLALTSLMLAFFILMLTGGKLKLVILFLTLALTLKVIYYGISLYYLINSLNSGVLTLEPHEYILQIIQMIITLFLVLSVIFLKGIIDKINRNLSKK